MESPKVEIKVRSKKLNINLKLYFFLKYLVKANLQEGLISDIFEIKQLFSASGNLDIFKESVIKKINYKNKTGQKQVNLLNKIFTQINNKLDLRLFIFSIKLILIKDLLLKEAKLNIINDTERLKDLDPLSLEYDNLTVYKPYITRVNGALLSLIFFKNLNTNFIAKSTDEFIKNLAQEANELLKIGVEPNQIFMLIFNESLNQSITSDSGSNYEDRIKSVLIKIGIPENKIQKIHDRIDSSTEFDFFFDLGGKTYGISAKRTLRERYKQFIKTANMSKIDVMIEITLGTDLSENKVNSILQHGVILFVADEIYNTTSYLKNLDKVYSCKDLTLETLRKLSIKKV